MQTVCTDCGGNVIEYDTAAGNGFCISCGTVLEENTIVNEVTFGETSTGAAMVQGSFVGQGASELFKHVLLSAIWVNKTSPTFSSCTNGRPVRSQGKHRKSRADDRKRYVKLTICILRSA